MVSLLPVFLACSGDEPVTPVSEGPVALPAHISQRPVPADNPMTDAGIALGRTLFYESALSSDGSTSCGSCHQQQYAFGDNTPTSTGVNGQTTHNTPPLINLAWSTRLFWDGRASSIEDALREHILDPTILDRNPDDIPAVLSDHHNSFEAVFPGDSISAEGTVRALAQFVRSLVSFNATIDDIQTDTVTLSEAQERGRLLLQDRLSTDDGEHLCNRCHARSAHVTGEGMMSGLFTTGALSDNGTGTWRIPTIRNIAVTAPYFHDGAAVSLAEALGHYNTLPDSVNAALKDTDGTPIRPEFSASDLADLAESLAVFTDQTFLENPAFGPP